MAKDTETRSTDEIEITPEMVRAGAAALGRFTNTFSTFEDGAISIFLAMVSESKEIRPRGSALAAFHE